MRAPQQLPDNELTPVARPIDAFVRPKDYQVAKPVAPDLLPQVKGITQVGQNSVGSYQGYNQAEQLASSLAKFNPALTGALQTGGVMLAGKLMDDAHKEALAAAQQAEALLDAQTELSAEDRAAAARKLTMQDPQAGFLMHALNPYRTWGWKRGMAYSMGQKLKTELPQLAAQLTGADYLAPDQGMSKLVKLRSDKLMELQEQYGVSENDPSYQNYVLEPFNKASDTLTSQVTRDRVKWMDDNQPRVIGNNVGQLIESALSTNSIDILQGNGMTTTLRRNQYNDALFTSTVIAEANKVLARHGAMAGQPGQRTKWNWEFYKDLIGRPAFAPGTRGRRILDGLTSTQPAMGADGKQLTINGKKQFLTLGEVFANDAREVDYRLSRDRFQERQRVIETTVQQGVGQIMQEISQFPPGSTDQVAAGRAALQGFAEQTGLLKTPAGRVAYAELQQELQRMTTTQSQLFGQQFDPRAGIEWQMDFDRRSRSGGLGDYSVELQRLQNAAKAMGPDGDSWYTQNVTKLDERFAPERTVNRYPKVPKIIDEYIDKAIDLRYLALPSDWPDKSESKFRQRNQYIPVVADAIEAEEGRLGRELTPAEARNIATKAMRDWDKENKDGTYRELFPGAVVEPDGGAVPSTLDSAGTQELAPTVDPKELPVSQQVDAPKPQQLAAAPVYKMNELDGMPNRLKRIRRWRTEALIDVVSLRQLVLDQIAGKPFPAQWKRLMRDAKVTDPFELIDAQLKRYPQYKRDWSEEEYEQLRLRLRKDAGLQSNAAATSSLQNRGLSKLARLSDWAYMA